MKLRYLNSPIKSYYFLILLSFYKIRKNKLPVCFQISFVIRYNLSRNNATIGLLHLWREGLGWPRSLRHVFLIEGDVRPVLAHQGFLSKWSVTWANCRIMFILYKLASVVAQWIRLRPSTFRTSVQITSTPSMLFQ